MSEAALHVTSSAPCLEARGLSCIRNEQRLFAGLSFSLDAGEALLIEGRNGSGKTSLLRVLCGLGLADAGEVYWCDHEVGEHRAEFLARTAYVGHANGIKLDLTVRENLAFARSLGRARSLGAIDDALRELGLTRLQDTLCRKLSAGQRRRTALARLLVLDARLWLLDEPLTTLDVHSIRQFETLLQAHLGGGGLLILTTHRPIDLGTRRVRRISLGT
jgi:heme exporter protein A